MPLYGLVIKDLAGSAWEQQFEAESELEARMTVCPGDGGLCRNSFVVLANVPGYDRQITEIRLLE